MPRQIAVFALLGLLAASSACAPTTTPTGPTTPVPTSATILFPGSVAAGETPVHQFSVPSAQTMRVTLASLTSAGLPIGSALTLRFGVVPTSGTGCNPLMSQVAAIARLTAHIQAVMSGGTYCVMLDDTSGLPVKADYVIRLVYGTPSEADSHGTIPYASAVLPGGFTARVFPAAVAGTTTVTMETITPSSVPALGVGIGITRGDGTGCDVAVVTMLVPNQQFSVPVDGGKYCAKVFDPGTLSNTASFALRILHP